MVHGEGSKDQKMDSLIKKLWFVHRANETIALTLADRVLCVNPNIITRLKSVLPSAARKAEVMTVSVDMKKFALRPFDVSDEVFRVVFAGRLDAFKDPPLMFRAFARLHERLGGKFEFHYVGTTDPSRYAEFAAIEAFTIRHGYQPAERVAEIAGACHAGVLTSFFEGMPCYLLETLSVGRPFCAIRLPQYDELIVEGVSGSLVERSEPDDVCLEALVERFVGIWSAIRAGRIVPALVRQRVEPYSIETQMARLFAHHRALQDDTTRKGGRPIDSTGPATSRG
jgi:glycosyltransferase involved in cell wall biosynthesis